MIGNEDCPRRQLTVPTVPEKMRDNRYTTLEDRGVEIAEEGHGRLAVVGWDGK